MPNQPPDQTTEQPQPQEQPKKGPRIRWLDVRFNGTLVCRVNAADPTHLQMQARAHGQRRVVEVSTKSLGVTGI
jgi:hypothetical protein